MWWHILKVEASADKNAVKMAYAHLMRHIDQDTDIDEFTKVNQAYREAMKTFKKVSKNVGSDNKIDTSDYLSELKNLYADVDKRLDVNEWKYVYACFSFREEEHLKVEYVEFFNKHYELTNEIWAFLNKFFPLKDMKNFKWKDLCNGNFSLTNEEIISLDNSEKIKYVSQKITIFYYMLEKKYYDAKAFLDVFFKTFDYRGEMEKWYQIVLLEIGETKPPKEMMDETFPWDELVLASKKKRRLLSKGNYLKARKLSKPFKPCIKG